MTEPNIPAEEPIPAEFGQANERSKRVKRRETMATIEEKYQSLSRSIESKFGDQNKSMEIWLNSREKFLKFSQKFLKLPI